MVFATFDNANFNNDESLNNWKQMRNEQARLGLLDRLARERHAKFSEHMARWSKALTEGKNNQAQ